MNKRTLKMLAAVNVALLIGLTLVSAVEAQLGGNNARQTMRPGDYVMIPARNADQPAQNIVYIIDQKSGRIGGFSYNSATDKWEKFQGRSIADDLARIP